MLPAEVATALLSEMQPAATVFLAGAVTALLSWAALSSGASTVQVSGELSGAVMAFPAGAVLSWAATVFPAGATTVRRDCDSRC